MIEQADWLLAEPGWGGSYKQDGGYYAQGFVTGLHSKLKTSQADQKKLANSSGDSTAMILIARRTDLVERKKASATKWLAKTTGIKLRKSGGTSGANGFSQAWKEGYDDGHKTDVRAARHPKLC